MKNLGIIFLCEGQSSTCSYWQQCVNLSRNSHWCWACCLYKKLFSISGVKVLEKYLWQCTFFSKVACWRPAKLLKLTSLKGNFKAFWRTLFLPNTSRWFFYLSTHLQKFWECFNSILTSYCKASVIHCMLFAVTLKKTGLGIYVYIWLPRNSACVLKHKQTWPEQAVYRNHVQALLQEFFPQKSFLWASASAFLRPCYCVSR